MALINIPDPGAKYTDEEIKALEEKINSIYSEAQSDIQKKLDDHTAKFQKKDAVYQKKLQNKEIIQAEYDAWKKGQVFTGKQWVAKKNEIAATLNNSNKLATQMINSSAIDVFGENANFLSYSLEHTAGVNFGFGLYNTEAVTKLIKDDPQVLPKWKINQKKDYTWNQQNLNRSLTQGIIQGESLDKISKRVSTNLAGSNKNLMKTFAKTGMTQAQNSGRMTQLERAKTLGLNVKKKWVATLDARTRTAHQELDGQIVDLDKPFKAEGYTIRYPGDPEAHPSLVYNCRCALTGDLVDYPSTYERYDNIAGKPIKNMTYKQWKKTKAENVKSATAKKNTTIVQGKDISNTWKRRVDKFDFEIEDVIDAQGFDGLPRVVSADEFDRYVQESNFIAQRTYSAPSKEILDFYQDQLYHGKWYVDCSTGGAQHGQGMYCAANFEGKLTDNIKQEMRDYQSQNLNYSGKESVHITETMTLDKDAKIIKQKDLIIEWAKEYNPSKAEWWEQTGGPDNVQDAAIQIAKDMRKQELVKEGIASSDFKAEMMLHNDTKGLSLLEEQNYWIKKAEQAGIPADNGSYAVLKGYDAIRTTHGTSGADTIILNRTKVIFKGE